jgi:hypothetical protein
VSLTGQLDVKNSPINLWFDEWLPNTEPVSKDWYARVKPVPIRRPDTDRRIPGTVGTAFDYRLRYFFTDTPVENMVAGTGMRLLNPATTRTTRAAPDGFLALYGPPPHDAAAATALIEPFREGLAATLARHQLNPRELARAEEEELCRYCYVLGWFEELYRAGLGIRSPLYLINEGASLDDLLALPDDLWIDDLCQLTTALVGCFDTLDGERVALNPTFSGSGEMGGADADLVVDGCLIDIKTTVDPKFSKRRLLYQLLGYTLLDYENEYDISAVAIYLSRQALLVRFELEPLLAMLADRPISLPALRASFAEAVRAI